MPCRVEASDHGQETFNARSEYSNSEDDGSAQHRINQYLVKQEIGRGSFGAVHLAVDQYGNEYVRITNPRARIRAAHAPNTTMRVTWAVQTLAFADATTRRLLRSSPSRDYENGHSQISSAGRPRQSECARFPLA